ncbi:hypothetical protein QFC22_003019 [Naganishia vaughanmartiniae]|uniref:Uncharacterized protein n=1 Tax=Naganishia vaughanmartiniae TaxID=1424756 RepID=A0ACC2X9N3_9TREE|nr:hypothetical protein QFC22_003019 [Naganishia vaughanmartiniae]
MGFGWQDPSPVPVAVAPATPVNGLDTSNDMRNSFYSMTGNQDVTKPRTRQEGFNVGYPGLEGNRISQSFFNNVFQMNAEPSNNQTQGSSNENEDVDAVISDYNLQRALAQHMQNLAENAAQMSENRGQGGDMNSETQNINLQGGTAMSPDDLSKFVARNITPHDLDVGQIAVQNDTSTPYSNSNNATANDTLSQALDAHFETNSDSTALDHILSTEYWSAFASTPYQPVDSRNSNAIADQLAERQRMQQRNEMAYNNQQPQEQPDQVTSMSQDPQRLFQQLAASFGPAAQNQARLWPNAGEDSQYLQLQEHQQNQRGRTGNNSSAARSIPAAQTLAQCLLPSFSPLEKGGNNFDYEFSRLDMTGRGAANPLGNVRNTAASATASAAIMNMDNNYGNMNGINGINPTFIDTSSVSAAALNPSVLGSSFFNQQHDMRNGYPTNGVFEQSSGTPRTSTSMLSTRSTSTGSGRDVEMKPPSSASGGDAAGSETAGYQASTSGVNPAHLQRPRSPSATRAGPNNNSSTRRSASNNRQRSGTGDGIGPARRPSFNSHTVARTAAMQGSYPHPHEPPASAASANGGRPAHRRSSSSTHQIQTLASGVNTLGIEKDAEWLHLAGIDSTSIGSPKSAHVPTFHAAEGGSAKSPTSTASPGSGIMLRSPTKAKPRTLSTTETTGTRANNRRKSSTSRNRRGSRTQGSVKKEELFDGEDSALMDADEVAVSDGEHEENIELTAEEMSKMTDAQIATEKRRRAHNLVERHRREAINKGFVELEALLSSSDIARKLLDESRIKGGEDDEDVDISTSSRRGKRSKKNTKKTSGGGMCKETILQSAIGTLQEQRRIIDEQRSIINQLRSQPAMVTPSNVPLGIPDSVFHHLNASYLALGLAGGDDQLRAIDDSMSGQLAPSMQQAPDPLLNRGRRLASNSDIRARSRSGVRQMIAIQESPGEGPQG